MEPNVETLHIVWTTFIHRFPFPFKDPVYINFKVKLKEEPFLLILFNTIQHHLFFSKCWEYCAVEATSHRVLQSRQI